MSTVKTVTVSQRFFHSGELDADAVLVLHRDDIQATADGAESLIISKQRNGPLGAVVLEFDAPRVRFKENRLPPYAAAEPS